MKVSEAPAPTDIRYGLWTREWSRGGLRAVSMISQGIFALMALRFTAASVADSGSLASVLILAIAGFVAGFHHGKASVAALLFGFPWLLGLEEFSLFQCSSPVQLIYCGVWLGSEAARLIAPWHMVRTPGSPARKPDRRSGFLVASDLLGAGIAVSLTVECASHSNDAGFWHAMVAQPIFGFSDRFYFLTSAFVWLQGISLFRGLLTRWTGHALFPTPFFLNLLVASALFPLLDPIVNGARAGHGFNAPYEDIHAYGSIAVSLFAYLLFASPLRPRPADLLALAGSGICLAISYSRSAWLTGIIAVVFAAWLRLRKKWFFSILAVAAGIVMVVNLFGNRRAIDTDYLLHPSYIDRFMTLILVDSPMKKEAVGSKFLPFRYNLLQKAAILIGERPLVGHGIGSFYLTSAEVRIQGDPLSGTPEFAHNCWLQMAAEMGLPFTALFCALAAGAIVSLLRSPSGRSLRVLAAAAACYLLTQFTANSINIYISNQLFFWTSLALIVRELGIDASGTPLPPSEFR